MSRWYLTSSKVADRKARSACFQSRLHPSSPISGSGIYGQAYFKRVFATPNAISFGDENWVCAAGTIIYDGQLGETALLKAYSDFISGGVGAVQMNAIGHYALAVRRGSKVTILTDPQGSLNLYYLHDEEFWFVSNSLSVCASVLSDHKIDSTKLLMAAIQTVLPGEDTFYRGVKRLFGTQQIRIDLRDGSFEVKTVPQSGSSVQWNLPSIEEAVDQYKAEVREVFRQLAPVGTIGLFGTGGLDSRTILAALLDQKAAVQLMYGFGNTKLSDYDRGDLNVVQQLADKYDLPFQQLDWSGTQPYEENRLRELFNIYGFKYEIYGSPDSFLRTFNGEIQSYPQLFLGGYSPAFTNSKPWELPRRPYTFEDLIATAMQYHGGPIERCSCIADKDAYRAAFSAEVKVALDRAGIVIPESGVPLETFVKAKLFLYIRAESRFLNFANEFGHYIAPFLMKRLYDPLVSVPFEYRAKDEFQLRLMHALAPGLVDVPLFSGWGPAHIDRDTFRLIRDNGVVSPSLLRRAGRLTVPSSVRVGARKLYAQITRNGPGKNGRVASRDASIVDVYGRAVMNDPLGSAWFQSVSEFSPKELARIHHYIVAVNQIGYSQQLEAGLRSPTDPPKRSDEVPVSG